MNTLILLLFICASSFSYAFDYLPAFIGAFVVLFLLALCIPRIRKALARITLLLKVGSAMLVLVFFANWVFDGLQAAFLYTIRISSIYMLTLMFVTIMGQKRLIDGICGFFYPLKFFRVNINYIRIIITTSFCIVPYISTVNLQVKYALDAKGYKGIFHEPSILIEVYMRTIFDLVFDLMKTLEVKGV
ncbi:MAG: hypothetical protein LBI63_05290 [Candidatus Ancillula sp.]|jgi:hypothetical protein|nr:hypothetical protein [Candidatus Ancillula sp.]